MKQVSSSNKQFTSRELAILKKLYRSREFKDKRGTPASSTEITFLVYGSINTLSSVQRRAFRTHVNAITNFANLNVKLTLFSSTVSQYVMWFSSLQKLDNLLKGTTYQRVITVSNRTEIEAYSQLFAFFNYIKSLKFNDETFFNFTPSLVFTLSKNYSVTAPMRFNHRQTRISSDTMIKGLVMNKLIHTIESSYNKVL